MGIQARNRAFLKLVPGWRTPGVVGHKVEWEEGREGGEGEREVRMRYTFCVYTFLRACVCARLSPI